MRSIFLLIIILFSFTKPSWAYIEKYYITTEAEARSRYLNLFDNEGGVRRFYIGGTLCDKKNNIWNTKCQDALLEDTYGAAWPEVKKTLFAFQKAIVENDLKYLHNLTVAPEEKLQIYVYIYLIDNSHAIRSISRPVTFINYVSLITNTKKLRKLLLSQIPDDLRQKVKNTKYEDINFTWPKWACNPGFGDVSGYIKLDFQCVFSDEGRVCNYTNKISRIHLIIDDVN